VVIECIMCNEELTIEAVVLIDTKLHVRAWPCEGCRQHTAEYVQEALSDENASAQG
jgi:cytidine deaminase